MDKEIKISNRIKELQELAKKNKKIDLATLAINELQNEAHHGVDTKKRRVAFLVSLGFPPFGLIYALKYFFSQEEDGKETAMICVILTLLSIIMAVAFFKMIGSGTGANLNQIQQIKPQDIRSLVE